MSVCLSVTCFKHFRFVWCCLRKKERQRCACVRARARVALLGGGGVESSSIQSGYPANRQRRSPRGDMCNRILAFINKKRSYYVDWVSSGERRLDRCNLEKKHCCFIAIKQPQRCGCLLVFLLGNKVETIQRVSHVWTLNGNFTRINSSIKSPLGVFIYALPSKPGPSFTVGRLNRRKNLQTVLVLLFWRGGKLWWTH